jgi:molybdopterin converting factor small subunit
LSPPEADGQEQISRRRLLRSAIAFSAVGAVIVLGLRSLVKGAPSSAPVGATPPSDASSPASLSGGPSASGGISLEVKVMYFQMPLLIGGTSLAEEFFTLPSPASLRDLLSYVEEKHPSISVMLPTMTILVNGVFGKPGTPLEDGDEVDFIPAVAGG